MASSIQTGEPLPDEKNPLALARAAREKGAWMETLAVLGRIDPGSRRTVGFLRLHAWALEQAGRLDDALVSWREAAGREPDNPDLLKAVRRVRRKSRLRRGKIEPDELGGIRSLQYESLSLGIDPHTLTVLTQLVGDIQPATVFDWGSRGGGLGPWLKAIASGLGRETRLESADWPGWHSPSARESLSFHEGDLRNPESLREPAALAQLPRPWLIILRPGDTDSETRAMLEGWHALLAPDDVIALAGQGLPFPTRNRQKTPVAALDRFAAGRPVEYARLTRYADWFGTEDSRVSLEVLRRTPRNPLDPETSPDLDSGRARVETGQFEEALAELNAIKAARNTQRGTDYLRALCFLAKGEDFSACEAAKEELRYFPDHDHARAVADSTMRSLFPMPPKIGNEEFAELYAAVRPYTMLSEQRLYSLYLRTRLVCQLDLPGDLVECGVAAGGGSALMAATASRHTRRPRKLYACDTFEGMPAPTARDVSASADAESSGWGTGTCAAPAHSLLEVCSQLEVDELVEPVEGLFCDTLPGLREKLADGIAFLHMDGDWYESTRDILVNLYDKVQTKGFIQVDDYGHWKGCREAIDDFGRERDLTFEVNPIDYTGVWFQRPDRPESDLVLLNLGCGAHFHAGWINLDIRPATEDVIAHDLANEPLPFDQNTCRMVYHSHVLEHLPPDAVPGFLSECRRVLAPEGLLRIAVPDLEGIAREYLKQLDAGDEEKHEWMIVELVDQLAREQSGGGMAAYWQRDPMPAEDFVFKRMGWEARRFVEKWRSEKGDADESSDPASPAPPDAETIGAFRLGGEVHKWMYDRLSLERLLRDAGFREVAIRTATESGLKNFARFTLDADESGTVRKPDSLFIEARK